MPSNFSFMLKIELQLKVPALVLCSARPGADVIAPGLGRCKAAAAAAVAIAAVTIARSRG